MRISWKFEKFEILSNSSIQYTGWNATYQKGCGGWINTRQGQIESPGYPDPYPDNAACEWLIEVTQGYTLNLNFNSNFKIDGSGDFCNETVSNDYLELRNGAEEDAPPLAPASYIRNGGDGDAFYCGTVAPRNG